MLDSFSVSLKVMALYGQSATQTLQPEQAASLTKAVAASSSTLPLSMRARASAAPARAWATVSGMSLGPWAQPTIKTPSLAVATGSSLACLSSRKPSALWDRLKSRATSLASGRASMAGQRITMSTGTRITAPTRVFSHTTSSFPFSAGVMAKSVTWAGLPRTKFTPSLDARW